MSVPEFKTIPALQDLSDIWRGVLAREDAALDVLAAVDRWLPEVIAFLDDRADADAGKTNEAGVLLIEAEHLAELIKAVRG